MKTLFLNPNSSRRVTDTLREAISAAAAAGSIEGSWEVSANVGAPDVISSAADNGLAEDVLVARLPALAQEFDRIVLMSSLDTGYAKAREMLGPRVYGFTRSVLAWRQSRGEQVQAITFGAEMASLYDSVFADPHIAGVVRSHETLAVSPLSLARADGNAETRQLTAICERAHARCAAPVFVLGAVVLPLLARVREQREAWLVDPIEDLLAHLSTSPASR